MVIFYSDVSLPEGNGIANGSLPQRIGSSHES